MDKDLRRGSAAKAVEEYAVSAAGEPALVAVWPSVRAAALHYGLPTGNITACCRGRINKAYGRKWRYTSI